MRVSQNNQRLQKTKYLGFSVKNKVELEYRQRVHRKFSTTSNRGIGEFKQFLNMNWSNIREEILNGEYKLIPVRRVEIPKSNGGTSCWEFQRCWMDLSNRQ